MIQQCFIGLLLNVLLLAPLVVMAAETGSGAHAARSPSASRTQYILFNRAPGQGMYQGAPETLGGRLLSAYQTGSGQTFWVITESDRSVTTLLLPEDY